MLKAKWDMEILAPVRPGFVVIRITIKVKRIAILKELARLVWLLLH